MSEASRSESFKYELLDNSDRIVTTLNGVQDGGSFTDSVFNEVRGSASFTLTQTQSINWLKSRVRISHVYEGNAYPMITGIPSVPEQAFSDTEVTMNVDLFDKTIILRDDTYGVAYGVAAGTNIITKVIEIIQSTGETSIGLEGSTATLATGMVWDANTSKLKIVNDLLSASNYFALYCDGLGRYMATPYVAPDYRAVQYNFIDDADGMYLPAFTRNYDPFSVPNRYIVIGKTDGAVEAVVKTAIDTSTSDYSYNSRGRWITLTETDVDYVDAANLQAIADRKLSDARQIAEKFTISHPRLGFGLNDVVTFTNTKLGKTVRAVCQAQSYSLKTGGLISSQIRTVV